MTAMACQICRRLLNHHTDLTTGDRTWRHPASAGRPDHDPQPVPADTVAADYHCDFCSDPNVVYVYRTGAVDAHFIGDDHHQVHRYGTEWAACITCSPLVEARDATALAARAQAAIPARLTKDARDALLRLQQTIVDSLHPGRALTAVGKWEPTPVPAPILPKVRDRLTALLRGPDRLPANLNPTSRGELADGMVAARLYWIDPEFTDLTRHATSALPDTALENADLPAPHGLLAWATPLGALVATSWTSTGTGILVAGYRSIGAGLQGAALQRLREQVGWLIPTWCSRNSDGEMITRSDPAGPLAATLLLIAQQLAHTAAAPVDERIRKAYRRSRRQEPEVQLVRIRASNSTARAGDHSAAHGDVAAGREYRWWVRGHWRQQPYGPGRTQRRLIYINPQLRGPQDKPIKPTTTVRILGRHDLKS